MIANITKEDGKWSEKKFEGSDDLRTLECLRARLFAERQTSRVAKEESQLICNKLIELENQLKEETKLRNKAEKKLRFLKKKLESLNISITLDESEQYISSSNCGHSCRSSSSSTTSNSDPQNAQQESEPNPQQITTPKISENQSHQSTSSVEDNSASSIQDHPHAKSSSSFEDSKTDNYRSISKETTSSMVENERDRDQDYVDNSMALVPVTLPSKSDETKEAKIMSTGSVREVLDALRNAREKIQNTMERRSMMIRVGHF